MYKSFTTLDQLFAHLEQDKNWTGANVATRNRYPVRFILFNNFAEFNQFISDKPSHIVNQSIAGLLADDAPDEFLTHSELSKNIRAYIRQVVPYNDYVIYPFSELARFYDNTTITEFDSLVRTIAGIQALAEVQEKHVRLYIPLVGMAGKMSQFMAHNSTYVWEYAPQKAQTEDAPTTETGVYTLVLSNGTTYGVKGLDERYSVVNNLHEWLELWKKGESVKQTILCASPSIYANAHHAQPDNAFAYIQCANAYDFLVKGLGLDFGKELQFVERDLPYWQQLASLIDIRTFHFETFVKERLDAYSITTGEDFIRSWFKCSTDFDRWLLMLYFKKGVPSNDYILKALDKCTNLSKAELFANIATLIFDEPNKERYIDIRRRAMTQAAKQGVNLSDLATQKLSRNLRFIAQSPEQGGYAAAVKLLTPMTDTELQLSIAWVAQGHIRPKDIEPIFPHLYHYLQPLTLHTLSADCTWINDYFDAYRQAKIQDSLTDQVSDFIRTKNADTNSFLSWHNHFKTVKTLLHNRSDIDVFYWIDGLGVDWIPFISHIVADYKTEQIYLNEVHIATATLPTTTSINKPKLQQLLPDGADLPKSGDLDTFAHTAKHYPQYIIDEMRIVEQAVRSVLNSYNGKKIAFVSDHGITYLSQLAEGMKLAGIDSDHEGRLATYSGSFVSDNKYIRLDDQKTLCSLTHQSLTSKVDKGHGAHGGCTPEEVLVPILIVSNQPNASTYSVQLDTDQINTNKPVVRFTIKGLSTVDTLSLLYNGVHYPLHQLSGFIYESAPLPLIDNINQVSVYINGQSVHTASIHFSTGAEEDDLFGDF